MIEIIPSERKYGVGTTPQTVYSVAFFYDENHLACNKEDAYYMNIVEYDANGNRVQETYMISTKKKSTMALRSGNEPFVVGGQSIGLTLLDFWRFQFSNIFDLQEHIAEFLVAKALELDEPHNRDGWTLWDIVYKGIRIEVKETGYYYSWQPKDHKHDTPRSWDIHETFVKGKDDKPTGQKERQNDIYVFCLNTGKNETDSNPLELTHWEFYVVETAILNQKCKDQKSISLSKVQELTHQVPYTDLKKAIDALIKS